MNTSAIISGVILTPTGVWLLWNCARHPGTETSADFTILAMISSLFISLFGLFALFYGLT